MANNRPAPEDNSAAKRAISKNSLDALLHAKLSDKEMKKAVKRIGPRVYSISNIQEDHARFIAFGCQGAGNDDQKKVAQLIDRIKSKTQPHFYLVLGDNVYDWGASSPRDEAFKTLFDDFYHTFDPKQRIPGSFVILGNHDGNYQAYLNSLRSGNPTGRKTEKNEVAHTFRNKYNIDIFSKSTIPYNVIPSWSMPYYFYGIDVGDKLRIFCLNSNSFLKEFHQLFSLLDISIPDQSDMKIIFKKAFFEKIRQKQFDPKHPVWHNQAYWAFKKYHEAVAQGKTIYFAQHNPLQTVGKRANPNNFDSKYYESKDERENIKLITGLASNSQCKLLNAAYQFLGFDDIHMLLAAHDHNINLTVSDPEEKAEFAWRHQFISGGGGGKLDGIETFRHHDALLCHLKQHGIGVMNVNMDDPRKFQLDVYTTSGMHLCYDSERSCFIQNPIKDIQLRLLAECIDQITKEYFAEKRSSELKIPAKDENVDNDSYMQSTAWAASAIWKKVKKSDDEAIEIETAQNLSAYFLQRTLTDFMSAKNYLVNNIRKLFDARPESELISDIKKTLEDKERQLKHNPNIKNLDYQHFFSLKTALKVQTISPAYKGMS